MRSILRRALALLTLRFALLQLGLAATVALLFAAWLRIPDSGIASVAATVLLALFLLALALFGEASLLHRLALLAPNRRTLLRGATALFLAAALWFAWSAWIDHLSLADGLRAAYWNSKFPRLFRGPNSFEDVLRWLGWLWLALRWLGVGLLLAAAVPCAQSSRPARAGLRVLFSASYWLAFVASAGLISIVAKALLGWTPGHGLGLEAASLALRLATVVLVDAALACYVLAVVAALVLNFEERHSTPASTLSGTPETSQPRTTEIP
jgi:hypothetical protein